MQTSGPSLRLVAVGGLCLGRQLPSEKNALTQRFIRLNRKALTARAGHSDSDVPAGNIPDARSICDALQSPYPGKMTLPINKQKLAGGLAVSDDEVRTAVRFAFEKLKLVAEPGGAAGLAAALAGKIPEHDGALAIVISGANVDPELYCEILSA